jgi:hypothetical protein
VVRLEQTWRLALAWYDDRLDAGWMPKSPETMERILTETGLTGDFWRVR